MQLAAPIWKKRQYSEKEIVMAHRRAMKAACEANQFKIVMLGVEGSGKTCTVHSLLDKPFQSNQPATVGAESHHIAVKNELTFHCAHALDWNEKDITQHCSDLTVHQKFEAKTSTFNFLELLENLEDTVGEDISQEEISQSQNTMEYTETPDGKIRISIFDLGGQEVYYELHFLFLASQNIIFLTFNASVDLNDPVVRRCRPASGYTSYQTRRNLTNLQAIELAIQMVHSRCGEKAKDNAPSVFTPIVVLLGTHSYGLTDIKKDYIKKAIMQHFYGSKLINHFLENFEDGIFFIDNKFRNNDDSFKHIKKLALQVAQKSIEEHRLTSYLKFEELIIKKSMKVASISRQEALEISKQAGLEENEEMFEELLKFYSSRGILLYYPKVEKLKDTVFISPQEVSNLISTVLCTHKYKIANSDFQRKCKRFELYGLLEESFLDDMIKRTYKSDWERFKTVIFALLDTFHLAVKVDKSTKFECENSSYELPESGEVYFVPSMLIYNEELDEYKIKPDDNVVLYYFPDKFLCDNIFNHVLLAIITWCNSNQHHIRR